MRRLLMAVSWCLLCVSMVAGQTTRPGALTPQQKIALLGELQKEMQSCLAKQDYEAALKACDRMIELAPTFSAAHYNRACCLARLGQIDAAIAAIQKAIDAGWTDSAHARTDDDLASLRTDKRFTEMLDKIVRAEADRVKRLYEKGADIPNVKTVEGDPESGLRWRLRMSPTATKAKPNRLVIWLHPSGGSMNAVVEKMAPDLLKHNFAILVPTAKEWASWGEPDATKLLGRTLDDVAKTEGIDVSRPILFGFSAGGQMALMLWRQSPEKFGGLILDASYPVVPRATGGYGMVPPPTGDAVRKCPVYAILGDQDGGTQFWVRCEDAYRKAGVPLTLHYVGGQGHTWLFGEAQRPRLYAWLAEVSAGRAPGGPTSRPAVQPIAPTRPLRIEDIY